MSKPKKEQKAPVSVFKGDALDFLRSLYRDPAMPIAVRTLAAEIAAPYERHELVPMPSAALSSPEDVIRRWRTGDPGVTRAMADAAAAALPYIREPVAAS